MRSQSSSRLSKPVRWRCVMTNYTFTHFLRDLTAMTAVGAAMMLMLFCLLSVQP